MRSVVTFLSMLLAAPAPAAVFVPDDRLVSDPAISLKDPEFDFVGNRMVWQDQDRNLWLADIDPVTGEIHPVNGQGILVDTGLANQIVVGNGPEFGYGTDEVFLCYTKENSGRWFIAVARQDTDGNWAQDVQSKVTDRWRPICTPPGTPDTGRMVYIQKLSTGEKAIAWRELGNPRSERSFTNLGGSGGRWVEGERAFVANKLVDGVTQIFWVDIDTETVTQMTYDTVNKYNVFVWYAPEYGEFLMSAAVNFDSVGIYRNVGDRWERFYTFRIPSAFGYVSSPEPFVHNGRSYIAVIAASALGVGFLEYIPAGPSQLWITNIDPDYPFFRRIDRGTPGIRRAEPEPFVLTGGPAVYYTESDPVTGRALVRIADTGLGSALAGDSDSDGVSDDRDNCTLAFNPDQRDTDGDGIGNACDADFDNNCVVDVDDGARFRDALGTADPDADFNGDGIVSQLDVPVLRDSLFQAPGPAAPPHRCSQPLAAEM